MGGIFNLDENIVLNDAIILYQRKFERSVGSHQCRRLSGTPWESNAVVSEQNLPSCCKGNPWAMELKDRFISVQKCF